MSFISGTKLGPYEILSKIGAGGMGEVYRARDTRLERTVAIKVLPSEFSRHVELRKRLEREARTLSSLAHPHICSLYDVGQQDGVDFLVMEYLEGETLSRRLLKGALPAGQVLQYGIEIADALERAHRHDIVHRDLKPDNIMLTKDGAKLLDFGLARVDSPATPLNQTVTMFGETQGQRLTETGMVLGTFQYMAPEQLEGKEADARTDIFALGAVIYEMATGKTAFSGNNRTSLITAILASEPPSMTLLQPLTPPALQRVVKTCLAKDPDTRWQSAQDLKLQLEWIGEGGSQAGLPAPVAARRRNREKIAWALLALFAVAAIALGVGFLNRAPHPLPKISFVINPPPGLVFPAGPDDFAVSPDGRQIAFILSDGQIWVQRLDQFAPRKLPGTDGAEGVFWSRDSRLIGFRTGNKLKRIDPAGDRSEIMCDTDKPYGTWNQNGIALARGEGITRLKIEDCKQDSVTQLDSAHGEFFHGFPFFLPDGRTFLYTIASRTKEDQTTASALYIGSLDSTEKRLLLQKGSNAGYGSGYLVFAPGGNLTAQALDLRHMQFTGEAFSLHEPTVAYGELRSVARFSVSDSGVLVYLPESLSDSRLFWVDRSGKTLGDVVPPGQYQRMRLSPDGRNILVARLEPGTHRGDLWKFDIDRKIWTRLTSHSSAGGGDAIFSPDQRRIAFSYAKSGTMPLYLKDADSSQGEELLHSAEYISPADWSADGQFVLFVNLPTQSNSRLWAISLIGDRKPAEIVSGVSFDDSARFAPDGHSVVYVSERSGHAEVYLQRFPGQYPAWQVSREGGRAPTWSRQGKEIFFVSPDRKMMSARVGSDLHTEAPKPLFELNSSPDDTEYEVAPDNRFLMLTPTEQSPVPLHVVMNWTAEVGH